MKLRIINIRKILLSVFLILSFQYNIFSQGTDISGGKHTGMFIGFGISPSQSQIINKGTSSVSKLQSSKMNSLSYSMEIGCFFANCFGLSTGFGFISYKTQLTLNTYTNKFNTTDSENESYERRVTGSGIKEVQEINFLSVPFCINLRLPFSKSIGFFLQPGINLAVPKSRNYKSSGTFTYKGYYSVDNVLLEDLPAYGFPSNENSTTSGELELKPLCLNPVATAGFDFFVSKKIQIVVAACYDKSSSISEYSLTDKFQLSTDAGHINSLMGGSSEAIAQSMGLKIILRFYL
jgi:hypothetical protein